MKISKAESTRIEILRNAFDLIYQKGYQATSIDDILVKLQVTKGAFYYHFKSKEEMGIALISDVMHKELWPALKKSIGSTNDFRKNLYKMLKDLLIGHPIMTCEYGCPSVNLIQEMAPLNERFRKALKKNLNEWQNLIEEEIIRAQGAGQLSKDHDPKIIALYVITLYHGVRNMGKVLGKTYYATFLKEFENYLNSLK
ncbi:transcriptional regulator, TetR family [Mucilaginibacter lappiensis]|uniref:AcrR family transcriptional regulator n=1 Tax=Mucilaginibacter lappiensis TaxID=354630 RepID=A0ABR6PG21_9SPHI|nr:TetR/AcrR family transcriptional regulator [Mucilaginibacter lappiensis]MBB6108606.1 AcrR family transcriptional regulator [Mucilaginibacter lappiensis]SIQ31037.1 transcriptional regulator, TetR family [Mucilaginibacter lappiensis]